MYRKGQIKNLSQMLSQRAKDTPHQRGFVFLADGESAEISLTFSELENQSRKLAALLRKQIKAGERVILFYPPGLDIVICLYACWYAGLIPVPLFPPEPANLNRTLPLFLNSAKDTQAKFILTDQMVFSMKEPLFQLAPVLREYHWIATDLWLADPPEEPAELREENQEIALILYTSGSTGDPKGAVLNHRNMVHNLEFMASRNAWDPQGDVAMGWAPPYHITGLLMGILAPVYLGTTYVFMSPLDFLAKPIRWLKVVEQYQAKMTGGPNFAYELLLSQITAEQRDALDLSSLKVVLSGGEAVLPHTLQRFCEFFAPCGFRPEAFSTAYGLTEAGMFVTASEVTEAPRMLRLERASLQNGRVKEAGPEDPDGIPLVSVGTTDIDMDVRIVDPETKRVMEANEIGEIWVASDSVASGYWNRPEDTETTFGGYLADPKSGPYLRTGDLAFRHGDHFFITGRLKDLIIIRGVNYFPSDIETAAGKSHPALTGKAAAAFAVPGGEGEELVLLQEVGAPDPSSYEAIVGKIRAALSQTFKISARTILLVPENSLPRTNSRKVQRSKSREVFLKDGTETLFRWDGTGQGISQAETADVPGPENEEEIPSWLIRVFSQILAIPETEFTLEKSPLEFGIDSLKAVRITQNIETQLHIPLRIGEIFEAPSFNDLIALLKERWSRRDPGGGLPLREPDLALEARLDPAITFGKPRFIPVTGAKKVFLTGATGFLGAYFLKELLKKTSAKIFCLVRSDDPAQALERIKKNLKAHALWEESFQGRIHPVLGDLSRPFLGLPEKEFYRLAEEVDWILHNGASVNFIYSYWDLKPSNVGGTQEVIRLAGWGVSKPLHYISTISVFPFWGFAPGQVYREDSALDNTQGLLNGYAQSKWVAEKLVQQARDKGLPVNVYRVGEVLEEDNTNFHRLQKDAYTQMLVGAVLFGTVPQMEFHLFFVPVDFVAKTVLRLADKKELCGQNFHISAPAFSGREVVAKLEQRKYSIRRKPYKDWLEELVQLNKTLSGNPLEPLMPFLTSPQLKNFIENPNPFQWSCEKTFTALGIKSSDLPSAQQIIERYLTSLAESGVLPPPSLH